MSILSTWLGTLTAPAHASEWISGATGAGGAVLGSLVTIIWTAWYNRRTRLRERREKFAAATFAVYQRLNQIYSVSSTVRKHFDGGITLGKAKAQPPCTTIQAMNRMSSPIFFSIDELWALTQVSDGRLINRINSLDYSFNSLLDVVDQYGTLRMKVWDSFPKPEGMDGIVGDVRLTEADLKRLAPDMAALDSVAIQIAKMARTIASDTFEALGLLVHARDQPLGPKFMISLPDPMGRSVQIRAEDALHAQRKGFWSLRPSR